LFFNFGIIKCFYNYLYFIIEVLTPLPILFEVYKFVSRNEFHMAQKLLSVIQEETVIVTIRIYIVWTFTLIVNIISL